MVCTTTKKARASRLKAELEKKLGTPDGLIDHICETLDVPAGTAKGYLYYGSTPSLDKVQDIASKLGVDFMYWCFGTHLGIDAKRLEEAWYLFTEIAAENAGVEFSTAQITVALAEIYNDRSPLNETAKQIIRGHFAFMATHK